jgi:hypothetical protein
LAPSIRGIRFKPRRIREVARKERLSLPTFWSGNVAGGATQSPATRAAKGRKGPEPKTLRRFDDGDRALFKELEQTMHGKKMSRTAAAQHLAQLDKVAGSGTPESRAKRLAALYKRERGNFTGR